MKKSHRRKPKPSREVSRLASDECYTPKEYVALARLVLGTIELDPFSNVQAQKIVRATKWFGVTRDGFKQAWRGRVWFQPPYSRTTEAVEKLLAHYQRGEVTECVALLNARPGSRWHQELSKRAWRCDKSARIKFYGPGTSKGNGWNDSCFFYLGPTPERFCAVFERVGHIYPPARPVGYSARRCSVCSRSLDGFRSNAKTCSHACREKARRDRLRLAAAA